VNGKQRAVQPNESPFEILKIKGAWPDFKFICSLTRESTLYIKVRKKKEKERKKEKRKETKRKKRKK